MEWCSYDAEGDAGSKGLLGVSFVSKTTEGYYTRPDDIVRILRLHAEEGFTFVSHNAQYDIPVVFWQLRQDVRCIYYNSKFNHGEWLYQEDKKKAMIWDSLGLSGGVSLAQLGKSIGLPKLYTPQMLGGTDEEQLGWYCTKHNTKECIECYAMRDAEIVYQYMESYTSFLQEYNIPPKRTIGSAAVAIWKRLDQTGKIGLPQPDYKYGHKYRNRQVREDCDCNACTITNLSRQSYFGGRVDCFKIGKFTNVYTSDIISMYPYIMLSRTFGKPDSIHVDSSKQINYDNLQYEGVTKCTVHVPHSYIPVLPVNINERLVFPTGTIQGVWCNCELRYAISLGTEIRDIDTMVYCTDTVNPFSKYVETLMALRLYYKQIDDDRQTTVKILLNSLYGRIGIREQQEESTVFPLPKGKTHLDFPHSEIQRTKDGPTISDTKIHIRRNEYSNVMWASHITAYARTHLHSYLLAQNESILYCDTDSVFSLSPIVGLDKGLGKLDDNGLYDTAHIIGPKLYSLELVDGTGKYKAKGVPASKAKEYLETGDITFDAPYKPREAARRGLTAGEWHVVPRKRRLELTKRVPTHKVEYNQGAGWTDTVPVSVVDGAVVDVEAVAVVPVDKE